MWISLEGEGWGVGFGGYNLTIHLGPVVTALLITFDTQRLDALVGKPCRVVLKDGQCESIGHFVKDRWFSYRTVLHQFTQSAQ